MAGLSINIFSNNTQEKIKVLANSKIINTLIYSLIINSAVLTAINMIIIFFVRYDRIVEYIFDFSVFNTVSFNIVFFCSGIVISIANVIEAKILCNYKEYYYMEENEYYKNIFTIQITFFISLLIYLIINVDFTSKLAPALKNLNTFFSFSMIRLFFIIPPFVIVLFFYFRSFLRSGIIHLMKNFDFIFYNDLDLLNREISNTKYGADYFSMILITVDNISDIRKTLKTTNRKILERFIRLISKEFRSADIVMTLNHKSGKIAVFGKSSIADFDNIISERFLPGFKKDLFINKKKTRFNLSYITVDIKNSPGIKNAMDIINLYSYS